MEMAYQRFELDQRNLCLCAKEDNTGHRCNDSTSPGVDRSRLDQSEFSPVQSE